MCDPPCFVWIHDVVCLKMRAWQSRQLAFLAQLMALNVQRGHLDEAMACGRLFMIAKRCYERASRPVLKPRLSRASLLLPKASPWRQLLHEGKDADWVAFCAFNRSTFRDIVRAASRALPLRPSGRVGRPPLLNTVDIVGITLRYLCTRSNFLELETTFGVTASVVTRALHSGLDALSTVLPTMPDAGVYWPSPAMMEEYARVIRDVGEDARKPPDGLYPFGFLDGCALAIEAPPMRARETLYYNGWHHCACVNNIFVFAPDGCIIYALPNCPGSYHDSRCALPLLFTIVDNPALFPAPFCLLADSGFRSTTYASRIATPLVNGDVLPADPEELARVKARHKFIVFRRQAVEWGMRGLQYGFPRLRNRLPHSAALRGRILRIIIHLFNLRARRVGKNEIKSVYLDPFLAAAEADHTPAPDIDAINFFLDNPDA